MAGRELELNLRVAMPVVSGVYIVRVKLVRY
jgi:hypothetical protein